MLVLYYNIIQGRSVTKGDWVLQRYEKQFFSTKTDILEIERGVRRWMVAAILYSLCLRHSSGATY